MFLTYDTVTEDSAKLSMKSLRYAFENKPVTKEEMSIKHCGKGGIRSNGLVSFFRWHKILPLIV